MLSEASILHHLLHCLSAQYILGPSSSLLVQNRQTALKSLGQALWSMRAGKAQHGQPASQDLQKVDQRGAPENPLMELAFRQRFDLATCIMYGIR